MTDDDEDEEDARSLALDHGTGDILLGVGLIAVGLIVAAVTYGQAADRGTYVVAWGPVVVGCYRLLRGLAAG